MNNQDFGKLLKALRRQHNLTQSELAAMLDVTIASVSKWETGKNLPAANVQDKLCRFFNLSHNELHNPTLTLSRINQNTETTIDKETSFPIQKGKSITKCTLLLFTVIAFLMGIAAAGILFSLHRQTSSDSFGFYHAGSRYCLDAAGRDIYERSYIYFGAYMPEHVAAFKDAFYEEWLADNNVRQDVDILKLSFYNNEQEALAWESTDKCLYLFR